MINYFKRNYRNHKGFFNGHVECITMRNGFSYRVKALLDVDIQR